MLLVTHNLTRSRALHIIVIGYKKLGAVASVSCSVQNNILAEFREKIYHIVPKL